MVQFVDDVQAILARPDMTTERDYITHRKVVVLNTVVEHNIDISMEPSFWQKFKFAFGHEFRNDEISSTTSTKDLEEIKRPEIDPRLPIANTNSWWYS